MPLTARQLAKDLISHLGDGLTLSASSPFTELPAGCEDYLVNTLNLSLEQMREKRADLFRDTRGLVFEEPKSGTVSVENGSNRIYLGTLESPANGCTILIDGDSVYNEIRNDDNEDGSYFLLHAYGGTTGTQNATAWGDSAVLDTTAAKILGGMLLADRRPLKVVNNRMDWLRFKGYGLGDYGIHDVATIQRERNAGVPEAVWVESSVQPDSEVIETRIHCAPFPGAQYPLELEVQVIPTEVTAADLNEGNAFYFPVPGQLFYRIFRSLALYHWSGSPWFAAKPEVQKRINEAYAEALSTLDGVEVHAEATPMLVVKGY